MRRFPVVTKTLTTVGLVVLRHRLLLLVVSVVLLQHERRALSGLIAKGRREEMRRGALAGSRGEGAPSIAGIVVIGHPGPPKIEDRL
jgi:hypothetical protein